MLSIPGSRPGRGQQRKGSQPLLNPALSRAKRHAPETVSGRDAKETLRIVLAQIDDMKGEDVVTIDLTGKNSIGNFMVVATGRSQRHVASIADKVVEGLEETGMRGIRVEGMRQADWVLIDAGSVIVHVFRPEVRAFYNLEKMWAAGRTAARPSRS